MKSSERASEQEPVALQGVTPEQLRRRIPMLTIEEARHVVSQVHRGFDPFMPSSKVRRVARDHVVRCGIVPSLEVATQRASQLDPFVKLALKTHDGHVVETVRIPLEAKGRFSACVSSQVGCALGCTFCATGRMGLRRNLEAWEIVEQVRLVKRSIIEDHARSEGVGACGRVHGVVFQGMGEPLANLDHVLEAIAVLSEPSALAIDARAMTVCTSGLPTGIRRLAREAPNVRLGVSIGSARKDVRRRLMPIDRAHGLDDDVLEAVCEHALATRMAPMFAVTLLAGVNDSLEDVDALAALIERFRLRTGSRPRLSILSYNPMGAVEDDPYVRTDEATERRFRDALRERGVYSHKRYSGGADVQAACGQLAARG